jgi:hypothetical protein
MVRVKGEGIERVVLLYFPRSFTSLNRWQPFAIGLVIVVFQRPTEEFQKDRFAEPEVANNLLTAWHIPMPAAYNAVTL